MQCDFSPYFPLSAGEFRSASGGASGQGGGVIRRIFTGLFALLLVLGGGLYLYLLSSLPQTDGRLVMAGPKAEIRIERDADGIPLITAQDDEDASFGYSG